MEWNESGDRNQSVRRLDQTEPSNREQLLAMNPAEFVRRMAYWEAFFLTGGDLPIAGCRLGDEEWASIEVRTSITGGVDLTHPTAAAQRLPRLLPNAHYHVPVVTEAEWDANFSATIACPTTSNFHGERIAPVWPDFIRRMEN